jgi:hypothetical protein
MTIQGMSNQSLRNMLCTQKHMLGATGARKVRDKGELEIREN